jgi:hypothetical protein
MDLRLALRRLAQAHAVQLGDRLDANDAALERGVRAKVGVHARTFVGPAAGLR